MLYVGLLKANDDAVLRFAACLTNNNFIGKIQGFPRLLCKIKGFQGLEFGPVKFKAFQ